MNLDERIVIRKEALTIYVCGMMLNADNKYPPCKKVRQVNVSKYKFDSLMVIDMLDELNFIDGKKNTEIYSVYKHIVKGINVQPMSSIEFPKFVNRYFGYDMKTERFGNKTHRVFKKVSDSSLMWEQLDFDRWGEMSACEKHQFIHGDCLNEKIISCQSYELLLKHLME